MRRLAVKASLFTLEEVARITGGSLRWGGERAMDRAAERVVGGVAVDSRKVRPGDLFVALPGARVDGHDFAAGACQQGAAGVLIQRPLDLPEGCGQVVVAATVEALGRLAAHHRSRFAIPVIGVTGSTGKTTTKDLIAAVLGTRMAVLSSPANYNTEIGLPLALFGLGPEHRAAVLEMAMRGPGQIRALCQVAMPVIGVLTTINETHLERLGSLENIARAKGELLEELPADGVAVLNAEDPWQRELAGRTRGRVLWYGCTPDAAVRAVEIESLGVAGIRFRLRVPGDEAVVELPLPGRHHVLDALAAAAVGHLLGLDAAAIAAGLGRAVVSGMRAEIRRIGDLTVIDDTYNASPASTRAALALLAEVAGSPEAAGAGSAVGAGSAAGAGSPAGAGGRRVAVLGDMLELGPRAIEGHREVGREAAVRGVDLLVTLGDLSRYIREGALAAGLPPERAVHCADHPAALALLADKLRAGDTVLVKGSRGMGMEAIVSGLERGAAP